MRTIAPGLAGPLFYVTPEETPEGYTPGLPYQLGKDGDGDPHIITRWRPTAAERRAIAAGADIFMVTAVTDHPAPPVQLHVGSPLAGGS